MRAYLKAFWLRRQMRIRANHIEFVLENLAHGKLLLTKLEQQQVVDQSRLWAIQQPQCLMGDRVRA